MKKILSFCTGGFLLYLLCLSQTDGFSLRKIHSNLPYHPEWETPSASIDHLLDQPFYYLSHGAQVYAFVSKDGQAVLKFYRHNRATHPLKALHFLLPPFVKNRMNQTIIKREAKRIKDFTSYKLAAEKLSHETGLLYAHLNKSQNLKKKLTLFDKIGVRHIIDLDQFEFLLQKKADLLYPTLDKWIAQGSYEKAEKSLLALLSLLRHRCDKGIFDKDPDLRTNFGFVDEIPIQLDIGRFKEDAMEKDPEIQKAELIRITDQLCDWLDEKSPQLSARIRRELS